MRKNRIGALMLCLIMIFSLSSAALAAEGDNVIELSTPEDLAQLGLRPDGSFVLTRDIDMAGLDWEPAAFSGRLNGNGHTLYNLHVERTGGVHADGHHAEEHDHSQYKRQQPRQGGMAVLHSSVLLCFIFTTA